MKETEHVQNSCATSGWRDFVRAGGISEKEAQRSLADCLNALQSGMVWLHEVAGSTVSSPREGSMSRYGDVGESAAMALGAWLEQFDGIGITLSNVKNSEQEADALRALARHIEKIPSIIHPFLQELRDQQGNAQSMMFASAARLKKRWAHAIAAQKKIDEEIYNKVEFQLMAVCKCLCDIGVSAPLVDSLGKCYNPSPQHMQ